MKQVQALEQFQELIQGEVPVVAVFKTTWCPDCHYIEPFMPELEQKYDGRLAFVEIDRDRLPELSEQYGILGIPSFVVIRKEQELVRFVSKLRKSREEIEQFLERALQVADSWNASKEE